MIAGNIESLNCEKLQSIKISNPGCYASAMQFMLAPLKDILVGPANLYGISGFSGAGALQTLEMITSFKDNILPYSLVSHIHEKEVKAHSYLRYIIYTSCGQFF